MPKFRANVTIHGFFQYEVVAMDEGDARLKISELELDEIANFEDVKTHVYLTSIERIPTRWRVRLTVPGTRTYEVEVEATNEDQAADLVGDADLTDRIHESEDWEFADAEIEDDADAIEEITTG